MPLPVPTPIPEPTLDESKAAIEAAVTAALAAGQDVCEIEVPYDQGAELQAWVESEGMRCACVNRQRKARLVIAMRLAPPAPTPVPPAPEGGE